jgi:ABC-2 type transport system permease protein
LGGVFYAVALLPEPFKTLTHFDPLYYMISSVRFGTLGISGVNPYLSIFVVTLATAALIALNLLLFKKGYRLRS